MASWIEKYKKLVIASHKLHTIVADVDNLFDYDEIQQSFKEEGYTILIEKTGLAVRINFELQVRDSTGKFLIIAPPDYQPLPDILMHVHFKAVGLSDLFPNLDSKAIKGLSYNALCLLSNINPYETLSHEKTLKFLLENLYNVDFDTLTSSKAKERVLNALISVLLEKNGINSPLTDFLSKIARPYFPELVKQGLTKNNLVHFIQDQWQEFVAKRKHLLNFGEPLLNKSLGYLFAMEHLKAIQVAQDIYEAMPKPLKIGAYVDELAHNDNALEGWIEHIKQQLEIIDDVPGNWFQIVQVISSAKVNFLAASNQELKKRYLVVENAFNKRFQRFIENTYGSLFSLSGVRKPIMVSRILEHISASPAKRKALIVIDGMNYWQSKLLSLAMSDAGIAFSTGASLAYIPTITAWSRQAIFRGEKPDLTEDNSKEKPLFEAYWREHGVAAHQISFQKFGINSPLSIKSISPDITILGLVTNDLDGLMHGTILGNEQLKTSTVQWIGKSNFISAISELVTAGFQIYLTSDHGNVEAKGIKNLKLAEKVGAISRGKRHLKFTSETLLESFLAQNATLDFGRKDLSLYLRNEEAFTGENIGVITHGGSHFWEVIVPFITINDN